VAKRALHHRLRAGTASVLGEEIFLEGAAVHADPDRNVPIRGSLHHLPHAIGPADVAGIEPEAVHPRREGLEGQDVIEVDVGHERGVDALPDGGKRPGGCQVRHGEPDDVATGRNEGFALADRRLHVARVGIGHRLDGDGSLAAHLHPADPDLLRGAAPGNAQPRFAHGMPPAVGGVWAVGMLERDGDDRRAPDRGP
jgi:hypothetical protein